MNDGALMTNNVSVNLKLIFKEALKMKISNDEQCGCGLGKNLLRLKSGH